MATPTNLQNVDERGYVFVTEAADCQIVSRNVTIDSDTNPIPFPQDEQGNSKNLPGRRKIYIKNNDTPDVVIGAADVSITNGYVIAAGDSVILDITDDIQLYAIIEDDQNTVDLRTLELA